MMILFYSVVVVVVVRGSKGAFAIDFHKTYTAYSENIDSVTAPAPASATVSSSEDGTVRHGHATRYDSSIFF